MSLKMRTFKRYQRVCLVKKESKHCNPDECNLLLKLQILKTFDRHQSIFNWKIFKGNKFHAAVMELFKVNANY